MKILYTFILLVSVHEIVSGTPQTLDKIIHYGKEYVLLTYPMESFFEKYPEKRPKNIVQSTGLTRGYVATFEIIDDQLYLKDIEIIVVERSEEKPVSVNWKSVKYEVFPNQDLVKIDWITGELVCTKEDMRFASNRCFIVLEFTDGNLNSLHYSDSNKYNYVFPCR